MQDPVPSTPKPTHTLNKEILRLAIPNVLSNLAIPMLSAVDTALMGHLESEIYIGAIGLGGAIFNFIYWGFGFMRMGTTGLTAQAFGKENSIEITSILYRVGVLSLLFGLLLILFQSPILYASFLFFDPSQEVSVLAEEYYNIRIFAAPATIAIYAITGWFLGMQNATFPMLIAITVNLLNIGFNLLFIKVYGMKSDGVAWGTVIAQYFGLLFSLALLGWKYRSHLTSWKWKMILQMEELKRFFKVNFDIFIRTLCLIFAFNFFIAKSCESGDTVLAANIILLQFMAFLSYGVDGFAIASESLVGKYFGAGLFRQLHRTIKLNFLWAMGIATCLALAFLFFGQNILQLFTNKLNVINEASDYLGWVVAMCFINTIAFIWDGVFIGLTASKAMRNTMVLSTFLFFLLPFYAKCFFFVDPDF